MNMRMLPRARSRKAWGAALRLQRECMMATGARQEPPHMHNLPSAAHAGTQVLKP